MLTPTHFLSGPFHSPQTALVDCCCCRSVYSKQNIKSVVRYLLDIVLEDIRPPLPTGEGGARPWLPGDNVRYVTAASTDLC